jgi:hypothetical protein
MATQNSSTSSSDYHWRRFARTLVLVLLLVTGVLYGFVLIVDPYDTVPFSPDLERVPVDGIQRLFHPMLARSAKFDSAVIGNSNIRLLKPEQLNALFGGAFVNLGMNAASPWEQLQMFRLFNRHHQDIGTVIFGLDYLWCLEQWADQRFVGSVSAADFPDWMYDESPWNDFPPLNLPVLKHAWRQLMAIAGLEQYEPGLDGYTVFTKPMDEYKLDKARREIYGSAEPKVKTPVVPAVQFSEAELAGLQYPALDRLKSMLGELGPDARKIMLFVPYHWYYQATPGSKNALVWNECKRRVVELASAHPNAYVVDFMIESDITTTDENYWDSVHYTLDVADRLASLMAGAIMDGKRDDRFELLYP